MSGVTTVPLSVQLALDMGKQSRAGALGLLIYERLIVIQEEVDFIWTKKKGWITYLYIFNGWLALLWLSFDIIPLFPGGLAPPNNAPYDSFCASGITAPVYGRSKKMLTFLIALSVLEAAVMISLIVVTITQIEKLPVIATSTGCYYEGLLPLSAGFWVPAMIVEPLLCLLVMKKALGSAQGRSRLSVLLARDSLIYFVVVFAELVASTIVFAYRPNYINIIMPWSAAIPSLMGSRLLLNTRQHFMTQNPSTARNNAMEMSAPVTTWEPRQRGSISGGGVTTVSDSTV
ncbi:hypothetical protein BDN67DRAFT_1006854 [Paxillus ammoniavirescens]|nr:hypothetical protein BDN67DRAFT_1006854 [Paxillus ammoniavirescens]